MTNKRLKNIRKIKVIAKKYGNDYKAYAIFSQKTVDNLLKNDWYYIY